MKNQKFQELNAYKECRVFRIKISKMAKEHLPNYERKALTDQILRSSRSITANIAEGYGRYYYLDNAKFCRYSRGSLEETMEHLITANDEGYITNELLEEFQVSYENCLRLLNGYIRYLLKSKIGGVKEENDITYGAE